MTATCRTSSIPSLTRYGYCPIPPPRTDSTEAPEIQSGAAYGFAEDAVIAGYVRANENIALTRSHVSLGSKQDRRRTAPGFLRIVPDRASDCYRRATR